MLEYPQLNIEQAHPTCGCCEEVATFFPFPVEAALPAAFPRDVKKDPGKISVKVMEDLVLSHSFTMSTLSNGFFTMAVTCSGQVTLPLKPSGLLDRGMTMDDTLSYSRHPWRVLSSMVKLSKLKKPLKPLKNHCQAIKVSVSTA